MRTERVNVHVLGVGEAGRWRGQAGIGGGMERGENGGTITWEAAYPDRESLKAGPLWDTTCQETIPTILNCGLQL